MGGGGSKGSTTTTTGMFPNIYGGMGYGESGETANYLSNLLRQESPFTGALEEAVLRPSYAPTSASEQNILNTLMDLTAGRGAVRGLGAPTQTSLATAIAPTLQETRQQNIGNIISSIQTWLAEMGGRGALGLELGGYQMPQPWVGSEGQQRANQVSLCCFIFMEAYDGKLLDVVRRYRDEKLTVQNRRGYYRIADKIVPLMQKSKLFKKMVKFFMTDPMVNYGEYYYGIEKIGFIFKPVTMFWLKIFDFFGKRPYVRRNGEVL